MRDDGAQWEQSRSAQGRIDDIEVLRAMAITMVLVEHFALVLIPWMPIMGGPLYGHFGFWSGVDLFLVISGFVIGRSLLPTLPPASDRRAFCNTAWSFWVRRAWRLTPSAWLWLAIPTAATIVFNRSGAFGLPGPNVRCAISGVLGLANIHFARTFVRPPGGGMMLHYWSLSLEEQFYLVLPVLAFVARKRLPVALAVIVAAQLFLRRMGPGSSLLLNLVRSDALALGVLLSIWSRTPGYARLEPRILKAWPAKLLTPFAFLLVFAYVSRVTGNPPSFLLGAVALMAGGIVWVASYDRDYLLPPGRVKRAACWLGSRSYGLYLIHIPAYLATREIWFRLSPGMVAPGLHHKAVLIATALPLSFVLAELNFRFVEDPLRRRGARLAAQVLRGEPSALPDAVQHAA